MDDIATSKPRIRVPAVSVPIATPAGRTKMRAASDNFTSGLEAGRYARRLSSFQPSRAHVNTLIAGSGNTVVARARYLVRNNAYAISAVEEFASVLVGTGIYPMASASVNKTLRQNMHKLWKRWCKKADTEGLTDFYGLMRRAARELFIAGEVFFRFRYRYKTDPLPVPLQLQMIPSEMLDTTYTVDLGNGFVVRQGIEFNPIGKRVAYHFFRVNPFDSTEPMKAGSTERTRVPADEILHVLDPIEAGQIRGLSKFTAAVVKMWLLDTYDDAELERKKTTSLFTGWVTRPDPQGKLFDEADENEGVEEGGEDTGRADIALEPGSMHVLQPGEEVKFSQPAESGSSYEPFQYRTLLAICCALGLPYFTLTGDLLKANYSSLRAGLIQLRRRIEALQYSVIAQLLCQPVWDAWLEQAVLAGKLDIPDYLEQYEEYEDVEWRTPKWEWVDPEKDAKALILLIDNMLTSRSAVIKDMGGEPEEVDEQIAADKEREKELGIAKAAPPTAGTAPGQDMPMDPENPDKPKDGEDDEEDPDDTTDPAQEKGYRR